MSRKNYSFEKEFGSIKTGCLVSKIRGKTEDYIADFVLVTVHILSKMEKMGRFPKITWRRPFMTRHITMQRTATSEMTISSVETSMKSSTMISLTYYRT